MFVINLASHLRTAVSSMRNNWGGGTNLHFTPLIQDRHCRVFYSSQRCDGIYIRRMETCARSMQRIFRFSTLILMQNNNNNFSATFKSYLVTASLEENTIYCLKLRSMGGDLDVLRLEYDLRIDEEVTTKFLSSSCTESRIFLDASAREVFS